MVEILDTGISVSELVDRDNSIPFEYDCVTAFIGRGLCGPLNQATEIESPGEFLRIFGGAWPGSLLPEAVEQYFGHGGRRAVVVRVANGASSAEIFLPAPSGGLLLIAANPGSGESVRAAVDFDGIDPADEHHFNLTIQRLTGSNARISDQEIFRGLSVREDSRTHVVSELLSSRLVRVKGDVPEHPPLKTGAAGGAVESDGYALMRFAGSNGADLTDYDLVGDAGQMTGLFALGDVERFDFLYAPPANSLASHGLVFLAAAERYCAERGSLLIVDPPATTDAGNDVPALEAELCGLSSAQILTYFPRPRRRRGEMGPVPVGAALAGLLAGQTEAGNIAASFDDSPGGLARDYTMDYAMSPERARRFARNGVNALHDRGDGRLRPACSVTAAKGLYDDVASLRIARLANFVRRSLERGTRWVVFGKPGRVLWRRLELQVSEFLRDLGDRGFLRRTGREPWFFVHCNSVTNAGCDPDAREIHFLVGFTPPGHDSPVVYSITQTPAGTQSCRAAFVADLRENG